MVEASPALSKRLWVRRNIKAIEDRVGKSVFRVLSSEPTGKAGFSANVIFYDELAEWPKATARAVWDQLQNAGAARVNPLQIVISTAQYDRESLGFEQYLYAKQVLSGEIVDETFLPVIFEVGEEEDWRDENNWWKANPSAGVTVPKQDWRDDFQRVTNSPIEEARFRTLRLNQWVGHTDAWIASDVWAKGRTDFSEEDFHGSEVFVGIDMASRGDLASYSILAKRGDEVFVMPRFFMPEVGAKKKEKLDKVPYLRLWKNDPRCHLHLTPGDRIDPSFIRAKLLDDLKNFDAVEIGFDPWGMEETRQLLEAEGLPMVEVTQTPAMMAPGVAYFERLVIANQLRHDNPILSWNVGNCCVRQIGGSDGIMLDKRRSTGRIDGVAATVIGLNRLLAHEETYYDAEVLLF